ncbi:MAG: thioredoxin [Ignavibacteria bacterium 13_1_40CM_2_61_4]|nr:MAG: thioredoxin [Ignavibacteria bacterium 13_1_40CM_2_61_4]
METKTVVQLNEKDFEKEILKSELPALVDFYADWCGPCRMVSPVLESLSKEYDGKVKFVKINTDENQELAMKLGIMSIPTVMIFRGGEMKARIVGAGPASLYKQKINSVLN